MGDASGKESEIEDAPAALYRSAVWDHFAFRVTYDDGGMKVVDNSVTVCKHCATHVVYADSNTTNMSAHLWRIIPVRQLAVQGGKRESRQDNFCSPQLLNCLTVTSQTGQHV